MQRNQFLVADAVAIRVIAQQETHALEVIEGDLVAEKVEKDVLESASVSVGENEAITVNPLGVGGVGLEELGCDRKPRVSGKILRLPQRLTAYRKGRGQQGPFPWELRL